MLPVCQRCEGYGPLRVYLRGRDTEAGVEQYISQEVDLCAYCKAYFEDESDLMVSEL